MISRAPFRAAAMGVALFLAGPSSAGERRLEILGPDGRVLEVLGVEGRPRDLATSRMDPAPAGWDADPRRSEAPATCPMPRETNREVWRESRARGFIVDACGRKRPESAVSQPTQPNDEGVSYRPQAATAPVTIDVMTTRVSYASFSPGGTLTLLGSADLYTLSDSTSWGSGAGYYRSHWSQLVNVEVDGPTVRYVLSPPEVGLLYEQTDYGGSNHSSQGTLGAAGPLVLEALIGSTTAVLRGEARVVSNDATSYADPRFNYFTAIVGSVVPFELTYTIAGDTWQADTFTRPFDYSSAGRVDFASPISTPAAVALTISGPSRLPDQFTTSFRATVRYENDVTRDATATASWSVEPSSLATVSGGELTIGVLATAEQMLTLRASLGSGPPLLAEKPVRCLADDPAEKPGSWPMFQANARHTGYVPISLPGAFRLEWQKKLGDLALNPVAAGEGKVFATVLTYFNDTTHLFALGAADGATLWSKTFTGSPPGVFSVNPPSFAYGNVYVQIGNHSDDTWLRAFDGVTGALVFEAPHEAQWERYYAPTLYEGKAYVNGGYYGGLYAFDAYTGARLWFTTLPQYDQWTPAVDVDRVYAYVGDTAGLYVKDRQTGVPAPNFVPDPNFEWDGSGMNLAPVLGAHGDVIAVHDGRLITFDPAAGQIAREVQSQFAGQPNVAKDRIYAIDGGRLVVLDEVTGSELWSWTPPAGSLTGPMIVTDTHLLASTSEATYSVDLTARRAVWSYPRSGHLALADGLLYIAGQDGSLTALSATGPAGFHPVTPCRVVDTRQSSGVPVGGPALAPGAPRSLPVAGSCGVPPTATAVSVNVTVTQPGAAGNLRLYPGGPVPLVSMLNYSTGQTRANNAVLALGGGTLTAMASQPAGTSVHVILDVNGYFE